MKTEHSIFGVLLSVSLVVSGCGQREKTVVSPVSVKTVRVVPERIGGGQTFSGTVEEASGTTLSFPVAGTVRQIRVEAGGRVAKGELIASLDEASLQSAYDAAAAMLEQAEDACRRMKQLYDGGSLPEIQWVEAQSRLRQAQSAAAISRKNLTDGRMYAPFSGVISEKSVEAGQNVMPGMAVVRIVTIDRVKVSISVPENEISAVRAGQPVSVRVAALGGRTFTGKVVEKGVSANSLSRSYEVKALVDNPDGGLMPGMICEVGLDGPETETAVVLPCRVVGLDSSNRPFVWTNEGGKARRRTIVTGRLTRDGVIVTSGLAAGDEVIVEGQQKVSGGMDITVRR